MWAGMNSTVKLLGFTSLLALGSLAAGCATTASTPPANQGSDGDGGGGGGGGGGEGSGGGGGEIQQLDLSGNYNVTSSYNLAQNLPGTVGTIVNDIIGATSGPNDPTQWVLQQLINQLPSGTAQTIANDALPYVSSYLNDQLLSWAPTFVGDIVTVGQDFGDIATKFGVNEQYAITASSGNYLAVDTATGVHFLIGTTNEDFAFSDYSITPPVVGNVGVTMDSTGQIAIAEHTLPLAYGKVLRIGLDAGIIPLIDQNATNLNTLFADEIDCSAVGTYVETAIENYTGYDLGSSIFTTACTAGLNAGANEIYTELDGISSDALSFDIAGAAKGVDTNGDYEIDEINSGNWTGNVTYTGAASAPLSTATFNGKRQ